MVWAWQQWLSPRPQKRTKNTSQVAFYTSENAALYEPLSKPDGNWYVRETHFRENPNVRAGLTGPPLHLHLQQDEYFKVEQGVLGAVKDGVEVAITKNDPVLHIPRGTRHRFWPHPSSTEDLVFTAWADPCKDHDHILDLNFLRNLAGYLADCDSEGLQPSPFQLILFFHEASSILCPPFLNWMPLWLLIWVHNGLAWIAREFLG
uniref:Oxidoreductase iacF n=2 Tax=Pestalotiopsis fici (strain W106-1 / CGMCC3.15140) TaxID=1229662 RepID=IACF_PESFW|nr:RecName: Full=Oxidoreductase iacF; AltName: Full=Iso-A82775C biosynthesis cluster protein F [Pestalotiopsis fici W106-1]APC57598.1 putative cupin [Pestalotiopsis fici]